MREERYGVRDLGLAVLLLKPRRLVSFCASWQCTWEGSWRALHAFGTQTTFVCDAEPQLPALRQDKDQQSMSMPNFLIIGAMKSGTTALYYYLEQHPEIYMGPVKEPNFFSSQEQENAADAVTPSELISTCSGCLGRKSDRWKRPIPTFTNRGPPPRSGATYLRPSSSPSFGIRSTGPTRTFSTWYEAVRSL